MKGILRHRPSPGTAIGLVALIVALGGVAYATIPDSSGTIHGCFNNVNGNLRVVESASDCRNNETAIDWNQQGPPGPPGGGLGGATVLSDARDLPFGQEGTIFEVPGFLTWKVKCDPFEQQDVTLTFTLTNTSARVIRYRSFLVSNPDVGRLPPGSSVQKSTDAGFTQPLTVSALPVFAHDDAGRVLNGEFILSHNTAGPPTGCEYAFQVIVSEGR